VKLNRLVGAALLGVCIGAGCLLAADPQPAPSPGTELWDKYVKDKPAPRILGDFQIVELELVPARGKITQRSAALSSVIFCTADTVEVKRPALTDDVVFNYAAKLKGAALTGSEKARLQEIPRKARALYGAGPQTGSYGTFELGDSMVMQRTISQSKNVPDCIRQMARAQGQVATLEQSADCGFEAYAKAIDSGIPLVLEIGNSYFVCFGYLLADGKPYLMVANPSEVPMEQGSVSISPRDRERARTGSATGRSSMLSLFNEAKFFGHSSPRELQPRPELPLLKGLAVEPFERVKYTAYFIYNWRVSAEGWQDEIAKILAEEAKKQAPAKEGKAQ